jgi:hypothetical protein
MDATTLMRLREFLVVAKRRTYAGRDDDATIAAPLLPGSKQLEFSAGDLSYRDIYFGMGFFVGQETVQSGARVIWSMSYAGGVAPGITERDELLAIYATLRKALLQIPDSQPFRGPPQFERGEFRYANVAEGEIDDFHGEERILRAGRNVYRLRYGGGLIR